MQTVYIIIERYKECSEIHSVFSSLEKRNNRITELVNYVNLIGDKFTKYDPQDWKVQ